MMRRAFWILTYFGLMYLIATILGFFLYLFLSPTAMWVGVFTLMPTISTLLIYLYLRKLRPLPKASLIEMLYLVMIWIVVSFLCDAATYILIVPAVGGSEPRWTFFQDQSPWIWLSYAVLFLSGWVGQRLYLRRAHA